MLAAPAHSADCWPALSRWAAGGMAMGLRIRDRWHEYVRGHVRRHAQTRGAAVGTSALQRVHRAVRRRRRRGESRATRNPRRSWSANFRPSAATSASAKACSVNRSPGAVGDELRVRNAATLTPCGAMPSDKACVQEYLLSFAERAFRHPPSTDEQTAITGQLWTEMSAAGATLAEALGYGVYAILSSPSFLYRTELGADAASDGPLTPHELATAISLFLTDGPPDDELLAAAASTRSVRPIRSAPRRRACSRHPRRAPTWRTRSSSTSLSPGRRPRSSIRRRRRG